MTDLTLSKIPFNKPFLSGNELHYIRDAVRRGVLSGDGYYTDRCSRFLERSLNVGKVLLTSSCTHALELAFMLLRITEGDEVIAPSFTFSSTVNAFVLRGGKPQFVDIRPDTLNINEKDIESFVSPRTKTLVPVHYGGVPCQMDEILRIAQKHHLTVVEDAAQALGARFKRKTAGSMGTLSAFSFHETKNCICGEGGALAINDPQYIERAEIIRQKGTNRANFYRGKVDKYTWVDVGSSYVPSELQAAFLFAQLENAKKIRQKRESLFETYFEELRPHQEKGRLKLPFIPQECVSSYHLFYVIFEAEKERDRIMTALKQKGIVSIFHYLPLHLSEMGRKFGYRKGEFPVTERVSACLLRLPFYNSMTSGDQNFVIKVLKQALS